MASSASRTARVALAMMGFVTAPGAEQAELRVVPANEASWADLQTVLGTRGQGARCQCQRYRLRPRESFAGTPVEERADRWRQQTDAGHPDSDTTSGLVAFLAGEPVGWCAVAPRPDQPGLRHSPVPWAGRTEDEADAGVWAVTCVFTRAGYRRRGVSRALVRAAVPFARERGARVLEGYPMLPVAAVGEELHVGSVSAFAAAGLVTVSHPTTRRVVMRLDLR